jgi:large subunit ribosomal protein L23
MSRTITLKPRLNEKTYGLAESRVYVFDVDRSVNKHGIARAVEAQFEVKVAEVNTANIHGKAKRTINITGRRMKNAEGSRPDFKKAYVTLAEGHALPFFDAIEEEERQEQAAQEQFDKAAAKQADKEEKAAKKTAKSETKKKPAAKKPTPSTQKAEEAKPAEQDQKHGLAAWRGFRLRKKGRGDK